MDDKNENHKSSILFSKSGKMVSKQAIVYKAQEWDKTIRFRSLNRDHNFIFLKNKNTIQIIEPIKLAPIYSFHHNDFIEDFAIEPKKSSLIICTSSFLEIYSLICSNLSDYELKIKFELHKSIPSENIQNISVSSLGDCIVILNKHRGIKLYDIELGLIRNLSLNLIFIAKDLELFPLDVFQLTYDTRTIISCKYNQSSLSFIYKRRNVPEEDNQGEYAEKIIVFKEDILYLKEYQKSFGQYIDYQDSSIFFILTTGLNFLIMRKIFEINPETYDSIPNTIILLYIDLSSQTETQFFPSISFSLLYDNENPIFKGQQTLTNNYQSGIISMDNWNLSHNKNTLSDNELNTFLDYNSYYLRTISCDYLIFNFNENIVMYQINGLQSPPFNNPTVECINLINIDNNYDSSFVLLKITKTLDKNYSMFFIDKYSTLRKYIVRTGIFKSSSSSLSPLKGAQKNQNAEVSIIDTKRAFTIFRNIVYAEYNDKIRKTFFYEKQDIDSLVSIFTSKLDFSKMVILKGEVITKIHWLKDSNFLIFSYLYQERLPVIGIVHVYSKYLDKTINMMTNDSLYNKHIYINPSEMLNVSIERIFDVVIESPYIMNSIIDKKAAKERRGYNDIKTDFLIKANSSLLYCTLNVESNPQQSSKEYVFMLKLNWSCDRARLVLKDEWETKQFAFNSNKVYAYDRDSELKIFNVRQIDNDGEAKTVFQTVIFQDLLYTNLSFNNYVIFITSHYINSYDILNRTFYRIRNDFVLRDAKTKELNVSINLFKCGIYICLLLLNETGVRFLRIPRNKNANEEFSYVFDFKFSISTKFSLITLENGMCIFNETQMERLPKISQLKHKLLFKLKEEELLLLNSNANSLFDCETFLDFFLSDNEEIIKLILNIFCNLYVTNHRNFTDAYKNSKLIPNFFELNSIDYIIKIVFENEMNVLSMIGGASSRKGSVSSNQDKMVSRIHIDNAKLKFKAEEDDQEQNPIYLFCSNTTNLTHLKYIYDLISSEATRNMDNLTKYFILKMKSKREDFRSFHFKMSTADLCWLFLITNQEYILKFITDDQVKSITWETMTIFNIPIWLKSDVKLKELLEHVGRNEYKKLLKEDVDPLMANKTQEKNFTEKIALYFYLADKENLIIDFLDREPQNDKIKKFLQRDFKIAKNRLIAKENGDLLMNKKKYIFAAYFYLIADDIRSALDMTLEKLKDINLTICLLRLVKSRYGNDSWTKYYSLEKVYQEFFINFGTVIRDPWLVVYGFLGQQKIDAALEYMLGYDIEYTFDKNQHVFDNLDEYNSNLDIILKIFAVNVFDYKILIFAKNLEQLYRMKYEESLNQVKNVENTNFEDLWDMDNDDDDEEDNKAPKTQPKATEAKESALKTVKIEYKNLSMLCVVNSLRRGILYAPILNLFKMTFNDSYANLTPSLKDTIKCLISDRILLDSLFTYNKPSIEKSFNETESLFDYLEQSKIVKKKDLHNQLITGFLKINEYQSAHIPCFASNKIRETLIWLTNYIERLMNKNLFILSNFNFYENVNLHKVVENLHKFLQVSFFLVTVLNYTEKSRDLLPSFINKSEKNLYLFRIIFMMLFYLLFVAKLVMKYSLITLIFERIEALTERHKKIEDYNEAIANQDIAFIINLCNKLPSRICKDISGEKKIYKDEGISFFLQFLNYALITQVNQLLKSNKHLELNHIKSERIQEDHYVHEEFKFIAFFSSLLKSYLDNFDTNMEKYIKNHMSSDLIIDIHKELKSIYMVNSDHSSPTITKYQIIKIHSLFNTTELLQEFECKFKLSAIVMKYISLLCKQFKYIPKLRQGEERDKDSGGNYTPKSINHVQEIFKKGFEIATFPEPTIIQDFAINSCDISNFAVSLYGTGHRKMNILHSLLVSKRSEDFHQLAETADDLEDIYKSSAHLNYKEIIDDLLQKRYNELLVFINSDIISKGANAHNFQSQITLPPEMFNELPADTYEEDISMNDINANSYCKILESHPQLPLYLSSNNRGIISLWSYHYDSKKSLDEFCVEKITRDNVMKTTCNLARMKFNSYGNEFLACDQEGSLFVWSFDHIKSAKLPKISLMKNDRSYCKDACFLNNTGIIASTNNKGMSGHNSTLWDLLLPLSQCKVGQLNVGGNFIVPISTDATFAVCNHTPGSVHLIDIRRMEVVKEFNAHLNEIKAVKLSEKEKFMVTMGKDSLVKIWDLANKSEPSLVESFEAFPPTRDETKSRFHLNIVKEYLFASKDNSIKLLRNKLS